MISGPESIKMLSDNNVLTDEAYRSPMVSIVVPCYRFAHFLPKCVNSVLRQTHQDYEILIMDNCSPDNTHDVARSFSNSRVRQIRNEEKHRPYSQLQQRHIDRARQIPLVAFGR